MDEPHFSMSAVSAVWALLREGTDTAEPLVGRRGAEHRSTRLGRFLRRNVMETPGRPEAPSLLHLTLLRAQSQRPAQGN